MKDIGGRWLMSLPSAQKQTEIPWNSLTLKINMSKILKWGGTIHFNISFIDYELWKESLTIINSNNVYKTNNRLKS
jgi:hypothetical protein